MYESATAAEVLREFARSAPAAPPLVAQGVPSCVEKLRARAGAEGGSAFGKSLHLASLQNTRAAPRGRVISGHKDVKTGHCEVHLGALA